MYLKEYVRPFTIQERLFLHGLFWNQGVANVLVLADPTSVTLYSGLAGPAKGHAGPSAMENALVTGQYAPFMQAGAMLGYIYDGNIKNAHSDIDRQILKHERELKLKEPKKLTPSALISHQCIDETKHDLENRPFTVYHIFLAV